MSPIVCESFLSRPVARHGGNFPWPVGPIGQLDFVGFGTESFNHNFNASSSPSPVCKVGAFCLGLLQKLAPSSRVRDRPPELTNQSQGQLHQLPTFARRYHGCH